MSHAERWQGFSALPIGVEVRLAQLPPLLARQGVTLAYLFGSLAKGTLERDVDLALLSPLIPPSALRETLVMHLGTQRLDIVDLAQAPPLLRFEILRTGRLLYVANADVQRRFTLETLRLYRDTQPLRTRQSHILRERFAG